MSAPSPERAGIRYVQADGLRLRTSVQGSGPPLLLLTGIGASLERAAPFERALHPYGIQTVAVQAPRTGESAPYPWPRRMPGIARTIVHVLDALGYPEVDLLGVSFGGLLAQQLVHQAPQRVRWLVLAATAAGVPGPVACPDRPWRSSPWRRRAATAHPTTTAASRSLALPGVAF